MARHVQSRHQRGFGALVSSSTGGACVGLASLEDERSIEAACPSVPYSCAFPQLIFLKHVGGFGDPVHGLSGLPNANANRSVLVIRNFPNRTTLPPVVALNRSFESQIAARYAAFWHAIPQNALASFF